MGILKGICIVVGAVGGAVLAVTAAPLVFAALGTAGVLGAASTGTAIVTLHGAALTSASMACYGGSIVATTTIAATSGAGVGAKVGKWFGDKMP